MVSLWDDYWKERTKNFYLPFGKGQSLFEIINVIDKKYSQKKNMKILDLGCGDGYTLNYIFEKYSSRFNKNNLFGIDKNAEILAVAENKYPNATYMNLDLRDDWDRYFEEFDIVISINSMHEVYSSVLEKNKKMKTTLEAINIGKTEIEQQYCKIGSILNSNGYFIFFDGVESEIKIPDIHFSLNTEIAEKMFKR
jgi:cyclopropane fatty-acyl-phospholipid synthase-like methyltransferase